MGDADKPAMGLREKQRAATNVLVRLKVEFAGRHTESIHLRLHALVHRAVWKLTSRLSLPTTLRVPLSVCVPVFAWVQLPSLGHMEYGPAL